MMATEASTVVQLRRRQTDAHPKHLLPFKGQFPHVPTSAWVSPSAVIIGDVDLGENASVWPGAVVRCDGAKVTIGAQSNVQDLCCLHACPYDHGGTDLVIGDRVTVGHRAIIHGCTIGDEVLIGCGVIVLDGAVIQPRVMVAAGSLVPSNKVLESGWLYMGSPVKQVRPLTEKELAHLSHSAEHYVELAHAHQDSV
jgi:carbonic anhydrase/acetyltransferase-like protein (isoleucine patch superfamily)